MDEYERRVQEMRPGLESALASILSVHQGRANAIGRYPLVVQLTSMGYAMGERGVREVIKQMRRRGWLICAMPGEDGGYYLAKSLAEFQEFDRQEFGAKIADMNETRQAMLATARAQFGDAVQLGLIP